MYRSIIWMALMATLSGCGLGEMAVTGATVGVAEVKQAQEAKKTEERMKEQLEEANRVDAQRRRAAETENQ